MHARQGRVLTPRILLQLDRGQSGLVHSMSRPISDPIIASLPPLRYPPKSYGIGLTSLPDENFAQPYDRFVPPPKMFVLILRNFRENGGPDLPFFGPSTL